MITNLRKHVIIIVSDYNDNSALNLGVRLEASSEFEFTHNGLPHGLDSPLVSSLFLGQ